MVERRFSIEKTGECSVTALLDACLFFHRIPINRLKTDEAITYSLTRIVNENGQLSLDMGMRDNSHALARSLNILLEGSKFLEIPVIAIGLDHRPKAILSTGKYNYLDEWRNLMTTESLTPPCFVISINGKKRHTEFIPNVVKFNEYMNKYDDNIESVIQLGLQ